jgi:PIN domain nuclease of toxin-antitoxin system
MKEILLDTHAFLWWVLEPEKLPSRLFAALSDPETRIVLSVASSWEAQIKMGLGKLVLDLPLQSIIEHEVQTNLWEILPVHLRHTWALSKLPPLHRDPFDRLLIAQAMEEGLTLATRDSLIIQYAQVNTIWE